MELTASVEDYLRTIYKATGNGRRLTPSALAERRSVSGPSASVMLRRLSEAGLVTRDAEGAIALTEAGQAAAQAVVRRHRLIETFLVEVVGMGWDEVDAEAELLEHALSPRLEARIDALLGHPTHDPHGDPIPPAGGGDGGGPGDGWVEVWGESLTAATDGATFTVERVDDTDPAALRHLADLGVQPGVRLTVGHEEPFGGSLWVEPEGARRRVALSPSLVALISGQRSR